MNRRNFLLNTSIISLSASTFTLQSCQSSDINANQQTVSTTDFVDDFELNEISIEALQQKMTDNSAQYSARKVAQMYLQHIENIDKNGPKLNALIEINPDALTIADALDKERKEGKIRSILHGIPVLIKDNIDTADKMNTTAGSLALVGNIATNDAFVVQQLRNAGAVILGKTNLGEWANFRSQKSTSGWSSRGGLTKNPYILDRNPSGSSSGSGVAVAANLCVVAVGTETDGSVVCPAATNGVVGIKPTVGLISRSGIIPISKTQDTAGPIARTVKDAAILLGILAGIDANDPITNQSKNKSYTNYVPFLDINALKGKRIGVEKKPPSSNPLINKLFDEALKTLQQQGATIVQIELLDKIYELSPSELEVLTYEFKDGVNKYLSTANAKVKSLKEAIDFNKTNETQTMPYFGQDTLEKAEQKAGLDSKEYLTALNKSFNGSRALIDKIMGDNKLDAIAGITIGPACTTDLVYGDQFGDTYFAMPAAISGYPNITVPCGMMHKLPLGISFFSQAYTEPSLLGIAYAYEQASKHRTIPTFISNL